MKTTIYTIEFPGAARFLAFVVLVSGFALLNFMALNAQYSNETTPMTFLDKQYEEYTDILRSDIDLSGINTDHLWATRLDRTLVPETEASLEVESLMLDADYFNSNNGYEETVELEPWMLDASYFYSNNASEEAIELEPWMLDTSYFMSVEVNEEPIELEDWMLN